jgi:hypothetical protein
MDLSQALYDITEILDRLELSYAIMGGIAVRTYGIPRPTYDVDITLAVPRERLSEVYDAVCAAGYMVPESYRAGWVDQVSGLPLVKFRLYLAERGVDVDVFLAETPYQMEVLSRRRRSQANGGAIWLVSPEDLILLKLIANRPRDAADILDVLFIQGQLDERYLREWAHKINVADRLDDILKQFRESK